jgi:hypothetical protein
VQGGFDEVFGFGAGNEDVGCDAEGQAVELARAGDVLDGFAGEAALEESGVLDCGATAEGVCGVGEEPGAVFAGEMEQERFGVEAGAGGMRACAELLFGVLERFAQGHQAA